MARNITGNEVKAQSRTIVESKMVGLQSAVAGKANDITALLVDVNDRLRLLEFPAAVAIEADSPWENSEFTTDLQTLLNMIIQYPIYGFVFEGSSLDSLTAAANISPPNVELPATGSSINRNGKWKFSGSFSYQGVTSVDLVGVHSGTLTVNGDPVGWYVMPKNEDATVTGTFDFVTIISDGTMPEIEFEYYDTSSLDGPVPHATTNVNGFARFLGVS